VALYIAAAYWFTSSTSFANPAITIARALSDSFAGIAPADVPGFIAAQLCGASLAAWCAGKLFDNPDDAENQSPESAAPPNLQLKAVESCSPPA